MKKTVVVIGLLFCTTSMARSQDAMCVIDGARRPPGDCGFAKQPPSLQADPLARFLFPPELVMTHQAEINLTDRQRAAIQAAMKEAQGKFIDTQFGMSGEMAKLQKLMQPTSVDEARVLEQIDRVLGLEREVKRAQLTLMIRIKNQLTEEQQMTLSRLRSPSEVTIPAAAGVRRGPPGL